MNRPKRVATLWIGAFIVWVGLGPIDGQVPFAAESRASATSNPAPRETELRRPAEAVDLRCPLPQPTAIVSVVPSGQSVKKGDLLVELDVSALVEERIRQVLTVQKAETELILARESQEGRKRAAAGRVALAEKALHLAQAQLKAYVDGEYPNQLAFAEVTVAIAKRRQAMAEDRYQQLRAREKEQKERTDALMEADIALGESQLQSHAAENSLALLQKVTHANKVMELELAVAQREFDLARAKDADSFAVTRSNATISLAEMNFHAEKDRLAKLDDQINQGKIYAPQDGTVVYPPDSDRPGLTVHERQVLVRLLPTTLKP
jgi:HlyD family secretion protein